MRLRAVAVVGEQVRATPEVASDAAGDTQSLNAGGNGSRGRETLKSLEVDSKTSNVGSSHGGTAETSSGRITTNVGREDSDTWSKDVDTSTVVGERGRAEAGVSSSDGDSVGGVGGRLAGNRKRVTVLVSITGSNDGKNTLRVSRLNGVGPGSRSGTAKRQVDDRAGSAALRGDVADSPVETSKNGGSGSLSTLEDLNRDQVGALGDTVGAATDGTGNVGAMAKGVSVSTTNSVVAERSTTTKLGVSNKNTRIYNVGVGVLPSGGVVDVRGGGARAVADGTKTPGSTSLGS